MPLRLRLVALVAAIVGTLVSIDARPAPVGAGAYPGGNGLIAFARESLAPFGLGIFVVDPAGGAPTPLGSGLADQEPV